MTWKLPDSDALDELEKWMIDNDPILDNSHADWVWELVTLVDELLQDTGRLENADGI